MPQKIAKTLSLRAIETANILLKSIRVSSKGFSPILDLDCPAGSPSASPKRPHAHARLEFRSRRTVRKRRAGLFQLPENKNEICAKARQTITLSPVGIFLDAMANYEDFTWRRTCALPFSCAFEYESTQRVCRSSLQITRICKAPFASNSRAN